jgi:two-component system, OmpR family, alkaline phosphatase synthesis response regulator PhoP
MKARILLVEDEPGLQMTLVDRLGIEGYEVEAVAAGDEGEKAAAAGGFDLILLDIMLPGKSGLDVCRDLRQQGINTPIIMLTARDQMIDKILGLKLGADDYLTKPFEMMELLARVEAMLRRAATSPKSGVIHQFGRVRVDIRRVDVTRSGKPVALAAREFQLLRYLLEHRGEVVSREQLLHDVWGYETTTSTRTVDVHVAWLRQKLEDNPSAPRWILTVHGLGYRLAE